MTPISFEIPLRTQNPLNGSHGHWSRVAKRRKQERLMTSAYMRKAFDYARADGSSWTITLTRVAPSSGLDSDSLPASLKAIRDAVGMELGFADDSDPRLTWLYDQIRRGPGEYAVCVTLTPTPNP